MQSVQPPATHQGTLTYGNFGKLVALKVDVRPASARNALTRARHDVGPNLEQEADAGEADIRGEARA